MPETQLMIEPIVPDGFPPLPAKCFELIYADPPWSYKQTGRGAAENHYRTVSVSKLATLPIAQIAADDAAIAMWATWPNLLEALELMQAWGFGYKTCLFNWIKTTNDGDRFSWSVGIGDSCHDPGFGLGFGLGFGVCVVCLFCFLVGGDGQPIAMLS